jgi:hypothetical protein
MWRYILIEMIREEYRCVDKEEKIIGYRKVKNKRKELKV